MGDMGQFMPFFAGQLEERLFTDLTTMALFFLVNFQNMPKDMKTIEKLFTLLYNMLVTCFHEF